MGAKEGVVTSVEQIKTAGSSRLILAGDLVFYTMRPSAYPSGFVPQPARDGQLGWSAKYRSNSPKVYLGIHEQVFEHRKFKYGLALDGYLAWGLSQDDPGVKVLIGGGESEHGVTLNLLAFSSGKLLGLELRHLPPKNSVDWDESVRAVIAATTEKYPTAKLFQAAPLAPWGMGEVSYVGNQPLRGIAFRNLAKRRLQIPAIGWPIAGLGACALVYAGAVASGYYQYAVATEEYREATGSPIIAKSGGLDEDSLAVLSARQSFVEKRRRVAELSSLANSITARLAGYDDLKVLEMRFPASGNKSPGDSVADIFLSIAVPSTSQPMIDQANDVMGLISLRTGLSLRLLNRAASQDGRYRLFAMEGPITSSTTSGMRSP